MTFPLRESALLGLALAASLGLARNAAAGETPPDYLDSFVYPGNGAAAADEVFVLYADNCGRPHPDANRPAEVRHRTLNVEVDIYLVEPEAPVCLAVAMPDTLVPYSIGRLPKGFHEITRRLHVREHGGTGYRLVRESKSSIDIGDVPNPAVSGSWYDPQSSGSGMFLNLIPGEDGSVTGQALLYVLTRRTTGEAAWLGGVDGFENGVLSVALQAPGAAAGAPAAANALFTYTGCGTGRLEVSGDVSLQFPLGNAQVMQLTSTAGLPGCRPPRVRPVSMD
jgi:hypothetical protein